MEMSKTNSACPDYVAALIVAIRLPLMLAARIHVIIWEIAVTKQAKAASARTQTTATTARLASAAGAAHSRRASTPLLGHSGLTRDSARAALIVRQRTLGDVNNARRDTESLIGILLPR